MNTTIDPPVQNKTGDWKGFSAMSAIVAEAGTLDFLLQLSVRFHFLTAAILDASKVAASQGPELSHGWQRMAT